VELHDFAIINFKIKYIFKLSLNVKLKSIFM